MRTVTRWWGNGRAKKNLTDEGEPKDREGLPTSGRGTEQYSLTGLRTPIKLEKGETRKKGKRA